MTVTRIRNFGGTAGADGATRPGSATAQDEVTVVLVECAGQQLGLPARRVEQVRQAAQVTRLPDLPPLVEGVVNVRGEIVPVLDGRRRLGISHSDVRPTDRFVIVRASGRRLAIHVEAAVGVVEVPAADLDEAAALGREAFGCKGIARLRGGLFVAHDMDALLSPHELVRTERAIATAQLGAGNANG